MKKLYAQFRKEGLGAPRKFTVTFIKTKGIDYCGKSPKCRNDGHEIRQGRLATAAPKLMTRDQDKIDELFSSKRSVDEEVQEQEQEQEGGGLQYRTFRAKTGVELVTLEDYQIGEKFERILASNEDLPDGFPFEKDGDETYIIDEIVGEVDDEV